MEGRRTTSSSHERRSVWTSLAFACLLGTSIASCAEPSYGRRTFDRNTPELARAASKRQEWSEAASRWHELFVANGPDSHEACLEGSLAMWKLDDRDAAKQLLDAGLARWPNDPDVLEMQGRLLADMGFRRAAELSLTKSLDADPSRADTWLELARVRMDLGLASGVCDACAKRIELGHGCVETYLLLGQASAVCGKFTAAFAAYDRAFALDHCTPDDFVRAGALYRDDRVRKKLPIAAETARGWLEHAISIDPQNTVAHFTLGLIAEDEEKLDEAIVHFRRAIETDPAFEPAFVDLIKLYIRRGDPDAAHSIAVHAKKVFAKDAAKCAEIDAALAEPAPAAKPTEDAPAKPAADGR